ncbi:MAG: adenylosuccinate synthetase, partial [Dermabacter sp.]|nr:adenylosuccinate synthetase [Dermabacter sp.]
PTAGGACMGSGIGPTRIDRAIGIVKAYTTRVGAGPFPTELFDKWGEYLQQKGHEVGVNTGRPRRCGWYDALMIRHAVRINGFTDLVLTKLDILTGLDEVPICTAYEIDGEIHRDMPMTQTEFHHAKPVYETMPGWSEDISKARTFEQLPIEAQNYVRRLEDLAGCRISAIGVGPDRDDTIAVHSLIPSEERLAGEGSDGAGA